MAEGHVQEPFPSEGDSGFRGGDEVEGDISEICGCAQKGIHISKADVPQLRKLIISRLSFFFLDLFWFQVSECKRYYN